MDGHSSGAVPSGDSEAECSLSARSSVTELVRSCGSQHHGVDCHGKTNRSESSDPVSASKRGTLNRLALEVLTPTSGLSVY